MKLLMDMDATNRPNWHIHRHMSDGDRGLKYLWGRTRGGVAIFA